MPGYFLTELSFACTRTVSVLCGTLGTHGAWPRNFEKILRGPALIVATKHEDCDRQLEARVTIFGGSGRTWALLGSDCPSSCGVLNLLWRMKAKTPGSAVIAGFPIAATCSVESVPVREAPSSNGHCFLQ